MLRAVVALFALSIGASPSLSQPIEWWSEVDFIPWVFTSEQEPEEGSDFGESIAVSGELMFVGAPGGGEGRGRIYLYRRFAGIWFQHQALWMYGDRDQRIGTRLAVSGNLLFTSGPTHSGYPITPILVVYERAETGYWFPIASMTSPEIGETGESRFGESIAVDGDRVFVGAAELDDSAGAVFVFDRSGDDWIQTAKITAEDEQATRFGKTVAFAGDTLIVTADGENPYVFSQLEDSWTLVDQISPPAGDDGVLIAHTHSNYNDSLLAFTNSSFDRIYVYDYGIHGWQHHSTIHDLPDQYRSIAVSQDTLLLGGYLDGVFHYAWNGMDWDLTSRLTPEGHFMPDLVLNGHLAHIGAPESGSAPYWWVGAGAVYNYDLTSPQCTFADVSSPLGVVDFSDVSVFLTEFSSGSSVADLAPPFGTLDFSDIAQFLSLFAAGCP